MTEHEPPQRMTQEESLYHQAIVFDGLPLLFDTAPTPEQLKDNPTWQQYKKDKEEWLDSVTPTVW